MNNCLNSSAIFIEDSVDFLTSDNGFVLELILIQHSLVNGCLIITPAKSTFEAFRSSCWTMYNIPISVSVIEIVISLASELITCASMYSEKALIADINHMNRNNGRKQNIRNNTSKIQGGVLI